MHNDKKELLIIIPAYNESKTIGLLLNQLESPKISEIADVLVVNDASVDDTGEIVKSKNFAMINNVYNLGYGSGLQIGYKYAVKNGYRYLIQMDADGQHDICNIRVLYDSLRRKDEQGKTPDIVLGSRFVEGGKGYPVSFIKKIAYILFRVLIRLGTGKIIMDPTTGLQGLSRRAFTYYAKYKHFDDQYPDANMIMQMILLKYRVEEVPAVMHVRKEGVSMHSGLKPVIYMFRMMFSLVAVWLRIKLFHVDGEVVDEGDVS